MMKYNRIDQYYMLSYVIFILKIDLPSGRSSVIRHVVHVSHMCATCISETCSTHSTCRPRVPYEKHIIQILKILIFIKSISQILLNNFKFLNLFQIDNKVSKFYLFKTKRSPKICSTSISSGSR